MSLTQGAYHIATWGHILVGIGIIGSVAQAVAVNQPLLNVAFGQQRGAMLSLGALAISHFATTLTAYGEPIGGATTSSTAIATVTNPIEATSESVVPTTTRHLESTSS